MNWTEFFEMGGYAFYVWSAWGLTALVMLWQIVQPKLRSAKIKKQLKRQIARERTLANHGQPESPIQP